MQHIDFVKIKSIIYIPLLDAISVIAIITIISWTGCFSGSQGSSGRSNLKLRVQTF